MNADERRLKRNHLSLAEELRVKAGNRLELKSDGSSTARRKEHGVWVFRTGRRIPNAVTEQVLREERERRDRYNR